MLEKLDPQETGLLVTDMQNSFCHGKGSLAREGVDISALSAIVPKLKELVTLCKEKGIPDLWSIQEHHLVDRTRECHKITPHTMKRVVPTCLRGTWDAEILDELKPLVDERSHPFHKQKFSCFYNTQLEVLLRILGMRVLMITGVVTNVCVETTARDAYMRDYDVIIVEDCVASMDEDLHRATLKNVRQRLGMVATVEQIRAMLA